MAFTGHVEDRIPIRELVGACSDAVMRQDEGLYRLLERRRHPHWPGHGMAFTGHVEDRIPIRELVGAYSDAVMRQDEGLYRLLERRRHPHGQDMECTGHSALRAQWRQFWTILEKMAFFAEIGAIEVSGAEVRHVATRIGFCRAKIAGWTDRIATYLIAYSP